MDLVGEAQPLVQRGRPTTLVGVDHHRPAAKGGGAVHHVSEKGAGNTAAAEPEPGPEQEHVAVDPFVEPADGGHFAAEPGEQSLSLPGHLGASDGELTLEGLGRRRLLGVGEGLELDRPPDRRSSPSRDTLSIARPSGPPLSK